MYVIIKKKRDRPKKFTYSYQLSIIQEASWYMKEDGMLDMDKLLSRRKRHGERKYSKKKKPLRERGLRYPFQSNPYQRLVKSRLSHQIIEQCSYFI